MSETITIDISDDENEDWLRTVRKESEAAETQVERNARITADDALEPAKRKRRAEKLTSFAKKK